MNETATKPGYIRESLPVKLCKGYEKGEVKISLSCMSFRCCCSVTGKTEIGYFSACPQWDPVSFVNYQFLIKLTLRLILTQNKETNKAIWSCHPWKWTFTSKIYGVLTLYTQISICIFSMLFSKHFPKVLKRRICLTTRSFFSSWSLLVTLVFDSGVTLKEK